MVGHDAARGFDAAALLYERSRPEYPPEAVGLLVRLLALRAGRTLLDLGAGTGKLSRLVAARGATVVAIEPAAAMIRQAGGPGILVVRGLAEMHRVLRRGGRLALLWNQRDDTEPWVAALSAIVNRHEGDAPRYRSGAWREAFDASRDLFRPVEEAHFPHVHRVPPDGVVGRVASVSFVAALDAPAREAVLEEVRALLASHPATAGKDELALAYRADLFTWERI